jgi:hypothetical protein
VQPQYYMALILANQLETLAYANLSERQELHRWGIARSASLGRVMTVLTLNLSGLS